MYKQQIESNTTDYDYYLQSLNQFYLAGHGATTFTQIKQEKDPRTDKGRLDLLGLYNHGAVKTAEAPRDRAGYLPSF